MCFSGSASHVAKARIGHPFVYPIVAGCFNVVEKLKGEAPYMVGRDVGEAESERSGIIGAGGGHGKVASLQLIVDDQRESIVDFPVDLMDHFQVLKKLFCWRKTAALLSEEGGGEKEKFEFTQCHGDFERVGLCSDFFQVYIEID